MLGQLNEDQLDNLAKFCLDLSKGAFIFAVFSSAGQNYTELINKFFSLFLGIILIFIAMVLLKMKARSTWIGRNILGR